MCNDWNDIRTENRFISWFNLIKFNSPVWIGAVDTQYFPIKTLFIILFVTEAWTWKQQPICLSFESMYTFSY